MQCACSLTHSCCGYATLFPVSAESAKHSTPMVQLPWQCCKMLSWLPMKRVCVEAMEGGLCTDVQTMAAWGLQQIWSVCEAMWRCNLQVHSRWLLQTGQGLFNASDLTW